MNYLKEKFKELFNRLVTIRGNPKEIALGFALGLFVGMSPTIGFQMIIAVFFAIVLKWNKFSAALAVWISNPVTAPVLYGSTYYLGTKVIFWKEFTNMPEELTFDAFIKLIQQAPEIFGLMTVGGIVSGIPISIAGYYFAYHGIVNYRKNIKTKLKDKIKRSGKDK